MNGQETEQNQKTTDVAPDTVTISWWDLSTLTTCLYSEYTSNFSLLLLENDSCLTASASSVNTSSSSGLLLLLLLLLPF